MGNAPITPQEVVDAVLSPEDYLRECQHYIYRAAYAHDTEMAAYCSGRTTQAYNDYTAGIVRCAFVPQLMPGGSVFVLAHGGRNIYIPAHPDASVITQFEVDGWKCARPLAVLWRDADMHTRCGAVASLYKMSPREFSRLARTLRRDVGSRFAVLPVEICAIIDDYCADYIRDYCIGCMLAAKNK